MMNISKAIWISLVISAWAIIFTVFLPLACDTEFKNQDALNDQYAAAEWVPQLGGSYYGKR